MVRRMQPNPIPWEHLSSPLVSSWTWTTPHFVVTIIVEGVATGDGSRMYSWKVNDLSSGQSVPFDSGVEYSFKEATDAVLELVGKSYSPELGYQAYAGSLASTFTINDGKKYDFIGAQGQAVVVKAYDENNREVSLRGQFQIQNYDFLLKTVGGQTILVPPVKVIDVLQEYGLTSLIRDVVTQSSRTSSGRIVYEEWTKGCTGKPGYKPGTTIHPPGSLYCTIHNV